MAFPLLGTFSLNEKKIIKLHNKNTSHEYFVLYYSNLFSPQSSTYQISLKKCKRSYFMQLTK